MAAERDIRKEVTDKIVHALEQGVMPWRRPWRDLGAGDLAAGLPVNALTGRRYNGGNRLILMQAGVANGYDDPRWLTFNQAKNLGGSVMRGERGTPIEYWEQRPFWKRRDVEFEYEGGRVSIRGEMSAPRSHLVTLGDGREVGKASVVVLHDGKRMTWREAERDLSTLISKSHVVFNVRQCQGLDLEPIQRPEAATSVEAADKIWGGMEKDGVKVVLGGSEAAYTPGRDTVTLPFREQFESPEAFYGTLLHELGHATGHPSRCARKFGVFGSPEYAREELVAELTSAFLSVETGIGFDDNGHAAYIGSWLEALSKDKHEIFRAAKLASQAADYMIDRSLGIEKTVARGRQQEAALEI